MHRSKNPWVTAILLGLLGLLGLAPAGAGPDAAGEESADEPVRLYTNADLEKYAIYAGKEDGEPPVADGDWDFVTEFLDRQHDRVDAERYLDLAHPRIDDARVAAPRADPFPRYLGWVHPFFPTSFRHHAHKVPRVPQPLPHGNGRGIHGPGHGRFTHLRGQDAVPGPPPNRPHNGADVGPPAPPTR